MGFFDKILDTLGFGSAKAAEPEAKKPLEPIFVDAPKATGTAKATDAAVKQVEAPKPVAVVDVVAQLEARAAKNAQKLNWKTSIVDLLKLLDIDSSLGARKELAKELGCADALMSDSAAMNMWLHKAVLKRLAENGGNVPASLLD